MLAAGDIAGAGISIMPVLGISLSPFAPSTPLLYMEPRAICGIEATPAAVLGWSRTAVFNGLEARLHASGKGAITRHVLWRFIAMHFVAMVRPQHGVIGNLLWTSHMLWAAGSGRRRRGTMAIVGFQRCGG